MKKTKQEIETELKTLRELLARNYDELPLEIQEEIDISDIPVKKDISFKLHINIPQYPITQANSTEEYILSKLELKFNGTKIDLDEYDIDEFYYE